VRAFGPRALRGDDPVHHLHGLADWLCQKTISWAGAERGYP
jgi:hypothetical protein